MRIIETKIFNTEIDQSFDYPIFFPSDGFYAIRITASAKAWWQHITSRRSFLKKDGLTIQLDRGAIIQIAVKKKLRADYFWNGNLLKGHELTAFIIVSLKQGDHILSFISQGKPFLKELSIFQITNNTISLERLIPSDRDRVLWLTFLFHRTVTVSSFSITARAEKRKGDDDDLKITIDGIAEKNTAKRAHRDWFWCGKILKGDGKTFTRTFLRDTTPKQINWYRIKKDWQQRCLAAWNWGIDNVPRQGLFSLKHAPPETQDFVRRVLSAYKQCQHDEKKLSRRNAIFFTLLLFISLVSVVGISAHSKGVVFFQRQEEDETLEERILDFDHNGQLDHFYVVKIKDGVTMRGIAYAINGDAFRGILDYDQSILQWSIGDVNENDAPDIIIHFGYTGSAGFGTLIIYEWDGGSFKKIFLRSEVGSTFGFRNVDMGDYRNELVYYYYRRKWDQKDHEAVYRWDTTHGVYELLTDQ